VIAYGKVMQMTLRMGMEGQCLAGFRLRLRMIGGATMAFLEAGAENFQYRRSGYLR
jgi:hypothetical protein